MFLWYLLFENNSFFYSIDKGQVELCLAKSDEGVKWEELFSSSSYKGEAMHDPGLVQDIHNRLAHLTTDKWVSYHHKISLILT